MAENTIEQQCTCKMRRRWKDNMKMDVKEITIGI
jgi:hypothetical protein